MAAKVKEKYSAKGGKFQKLRDPKGRGRLKKGNQRGVSKRNRWVSDQYEEERVRGVRPAAEGEERGKVRVIGGESRVLEGGAALE